MPTNRRADSDGAMEKKTPPMLHYEVHGEGGLFILFVHGLLSSRAQWLPNLPALTQGFRPVGVELLGHGRSPAPEDPAAHSTAAYLRYFEQIRDAVGADRWYLVGQSLGAALTLDDARTTTEERLSAVRDLTGGLGADIVLDCTGDPATLDEGLAMLRPGGALVEVGDFVD